MIIGLLFGALTLSCMAGVVALCLAVAWRERRKQEPPIYVWPVPERPVAEQLAECGNIAASIQTLREQDIARFATMWESGLGKEFPSMGRN